MSGGESLVPPGEFCETLHLGNNVQSVSGPGAKVHISLVYREGF